MSLTASYAALPPSIRRHIEIAQKGERGSGLNIHDSLRSVLCYMRLQLGMNREQIDHALAAYDSPARRADIPPGEVERLVEGMFKDGFIETQQARAEARARGELPPAAEPLSKEQAQQQKLNWRRNATDFMSQPCALADWWHASPLAIPENPRHQFLAAVESLFAENETCSLVDACSPDGKPIANDKGMFPLGWRRELGRTPNAVRGKGGVWMRSNPVRSKGSGKNGAVLDKDIGAARYVLVEFDSLPLLDQSAVLWRLQNDGHIYIRTLVDSAGKSLHALCELGADAFGKKATTLLLQLHNVFGVDRGNSNPSRLTRAPGFYRDIGRRADSDGLQRLLYLAPARPVEVLK